MYTNILCPCGSNLPLKQCCTKKYKSIRINHNMNFNTASSYELWSSARNAFWHVLVKQIDNMPKNRLKNIIILGAGACEDLPIDFICDVFEEIVLVDIDKESLLNSKKYIPSQLQQKVTYVVMDITGLQEQFNQKFSLVILTPMKKELNISMIFPIISLI